jgi:hypothetical protein
MSISTRTSRYDICCRWWSITTWIPIQVGLLYKSAFTYLFSDGGVVLSDRVMRHFALHQAISSVFLEVFYQYVLKISKLYNLLFLMNNYFGNHLWRNIKNYRHLGSRKRISTKDNSITLTWTNGMNWNHETQMKKSGVRLTTRYIDSGMTSMVPLITHLSPSKSMMCFHCMLIRS